MHAPPVHVDSRTDYRPDIDGLRGVAVLLVLAFHLNLTTFSGGYVGVDVFFVISGFLITQLIRRDVAAGRFTLSAFYIRRCRRILPALFFTLALTFVAAFLVFAPEHMSSFSGSLIAAVLSVSNVFFWNHSSYFDVSTKIAPLLHTWSLGVEEQFYIFYPIVLWLLLRALRRHAWIALFALGAASFLANLSFVDGYTFVLAPWPSVAALFKDGPTTIFYLAPFRAFEFAIGAVLAFAPPLRGRYISDVIFLMGIGLIAYAAIGFTEHTVFPSWNALVPCLGAAAVISANNGRLSQRVLENPVAAYLGLISYSVYLIHWPIIVFYTYVFSTNVSWRAALAIGALSIVIGAMMHRFVEQPFRNRRNYQSTPFRAMTVGLAAATVLLAVFAGTIRLDGAPWRLTDEARAMVPEWSDRGEIMGALGCAAPCEFGDPNKSAVLVIGDSYVDQYTRALKSQFGNQYWFKEASAASCYVGGDNLVSLRWGKPSAPCQVANAQARAWLSQGDISAVIHSQFWDAYFGNSVDGDGRAIKFKDHGELFQRQIADLKSFYADYKGPIIIVGSSVPANLSCYRRPVYLTLPCPSLAEKKSLNRLFAKRMRSAASTWSQLRFIDPEDIICSGDLCRHVSSNGSVLYTDSHHVSHEGAKLVVPSIIDAVHRATQ